jgi:hypothetical protein
MTQVCYHIHILLAMSGYNFGIPNFYIIIHIEVYMSVKRVLIMSVLKEQSCVHVGKA